MTSLLPVWVRESWIRHYGIAVVSLKEKLAYRFDFFTSLLSTMMMAALLFYLWTAIFENSTTIDMPLSSLITYVCLGQVISLTRVSESRRRPALQAAQRIRTGDVTVDLVRPVDYQALHLSDSIGLYLAETILVNLPAYLLALLVFGIEPPASLEASGAFVVSMLGAFLIAFSLNYAIGILAFWTFEILGVLYAQKALMDVLAGSIIPLSLFPNGLRVVALSLPFQGMAYLPLSIYIGSIEGADMWVEILKQWSWAVALLLATRLIWLRASRRIVIQGG